MMQSPIRVGLIGTGYAAKLRAEAFTSDPRSRLMAVSGRDLDRTQTFAQPFGAEVVPQWESLVQRLDIDLIVIATLNRDHGFMTKMALQAGKAVVVEYPLSLDLPEAEALAKLAQERNQLLHVEHIELLSGIHLAAAESLAAIGSPFYVRYATLNPQHPAPQKWTYQPDLFGFPFMGAVSRIHRLTNLFGSVATVTGQVRYWSREGFALPTWAGTDFFAGCICTAQLRFTSGLIADVTYGKGEICWQANRTLEVQGDKGALIFEGEKGMLVQGEQSQPIDTGSRRGLFAKDTRRILDHLLEGTPLYVSLEESLYALNVADAVRRSAETGQTIPLSPN
ncbi:MAG: Gfo/Idh/MocA family oxidoreductase [Leptolyngbyaceae cyanobacterium bins.59]|nr:Gfo/Idh/MocA family oxidoreductase [Leptolyngbyaceae cyanobacterium bins.59]